MADRLAAGMSVRCRNAANDLWGRVLMASDTQPQSVAVCFSDMEGIRHLNGALAIMNMLPLTIDYEELTAMDLWGNEWEIDVADEGSGRSDR